MNIIVMGGLILGLMITGVVSGQQRKAQVVGKMNGDEIYKLLEPDKIPAIRTPRFVQGKEADGQMSAEEPVMGIIYNGHTRAYSLWQLDHHEIVNDYYGDTPVGVTW